MPIKRGKESIREDNSEGIESRIDLMYREKMRALTQQHSFYAYFKLYHQRFAHCTSIFTFKKIFPKFEIDRDPFIEIYIEINFSFDFQAFVTFASMRRILNPIARKVITTESSLRRKTN